MKFARLGYCGITAQIVDCPNPFYISWKIVDCPSPFYIGGETVDFPNPIYIGGHLNKHDFMNQIFLIRYQSFDF